MPGTSGAVNDNLYSWGNKKGALDNGTDNRGAEWKIDTIGLNSGDYVLSDLLGATADPYSGNNPLHTGSFSYDFVYFFDPGNLSSVTGTAALYSIEYWVKKNSDTGFNFFVADTITKNSYNALPFAITQVPGRSVSAENLDKWAGVTVRYKIEHRILPIDTFYEIDSYGNKTLAPQVDVRIKTFKQIPIFFRLLRIRDWVAQRLLTGKADANLATIIGYLKIQNDNNAMKAWCEGNEPHYPFFHCYTYLHDLFVKNGAPPLSVLAPWNHDLFVRTEREQSENIKGLPKMFLWHEWVPFVGMFFRSLDIDTSYHPPKAVWSWNYGGLKRPMPITYANSDSARWYNSAVFLESNYNSFTDQWQKNIMGYTSSAPGGGILPVWPYSEYDYQGMLDIARTCYENDPKNPEPYWGSYQAGGSPIHGVPLWAVDSERKALKDVNLWSDTTRALPSALSTDSVYFQTHGVYIYGDGVPCSAKFPVSKAMKELAPESPVILQMNERIPGILR